jgi:hypothetical protein
MIDNFLKNQILEQFFFSEFNFNFVVVKSQRLKIKREN